MNFNYSNSFITKDEIIEYGSRLKPLQERLHKKDEEYTGWVDYPLSYDKTIINQIIQTAEKINKQCDAFVVIGVGGSYLGAKACIKMLTHTFNNLLNKEDRKAPQIYFAGHTLSSTYYSELLEILNNKDVCICVISKSGTTTEPNLAFSVLKKLLERKYKDSAYERIYVITDKEKGILREEANAKCYESFIVPSDIGGRYSVLTPVGLLPISVAGIDINEILKGAEDAYYEYLTSDMTNPCWQYAAIRNIFHNRGKSIEIFEYYEPKLKYFTEWLKQLFGESEGKEGKGLFPASLQFSTDLHSMGQFLQEGNQCFFETVLNVNNAEKDLSVPSQAINTIKGKSIHYINHVAEESVIDAHSKDGIPNLKISIPNLSPYYFGKMIYFFEKTCALSGFLLGINPFDQPGVEKYKKKMHEILRTDNQ